MDSVFIWKIRRGDVYWEAENGQEAAFLAVSDARKCDGGTEVRAVAILSGQPQRHWENDRCGGYGVRLYAGPQYSRPDWPALVAGISQIYAIEARERAEAHAAELRMAEERVAEARLALHQERERVRGIERENLDMARRLVEIERQLTIPATGIQLAERIRFVLASKEGGKV